MWRKKIVGNHLIGFSTKTFLVGESAGGQYNIMQLLFFLNYRQGDNDLDGCILHSPYYYYYIGTYLLYGLFIYNIHVLGYESLELPCE